VGSYHYVKLSADDYPRLYATPNLREDGSYYAGPFRKASVARRLVECLNGVYPLRTCAHLPATTAVAGKRGRAGHACPRAGTGACLAPCSRPLNGEYAAAAAAVRRVLEGHGADLDERLQERQAGMVQALAFEQAARLQKQREALERALRTVRRLHAASGDDAIIAYPAKRRGWVALWGVRGGRIAVERVVGRGAFGEDAARGLLAELTAAAAPAPPLPATMLDEMLLVHSWVQTHREAANVLDLHALITCRQALSDAAADLVSCVRLCAGAPYSSSALPRPRRSTSTATTATPATATAITT
jgi:DNA polymerase-3 subunit epsilon